MRLWLGWLAVVLGVGSGTVAGCDSDGGASASSPMDFCLRMFELSEE